MNAMIRIATCRSGLLRNAGILARQSQKPHPHQTPLGRLPSKNTPVGASARTNSSGGGGSSSAAAPPPTKPPASSSLKNAKTTAGTGNPEGLGESPGFSLRGPVTWPALGLVAIASASAVAYYKIERERRLENAMGKVVSSESGWSPNPDLLARRQYVRTKWGWFPKEDAFGASGKPAIGGPWSLVDLDGNLVTNKSLKGNGHWERRLENAMGKVVSTGKPAIGGPWSLVDLDGNLVTNKSFEGKWTLLYFGFARCPDICPSEMVKVGKVMDILKKEHPALHKNIQPIFVSIDPARDSLKALRDYSTDFHPSFVFLTGAPQQVQAMAKKFRVYMSKADETEDGDYLVDHSIVIYFHDETGDIADCFTQSMRPSDVVEKVVERMTFVPTY
eukprot:CAMPEP_0183743164 /NCGR_PEP_ID=MMETSP0737-20130205/65078_1 /TAXON_ID=385413 /ORGANISM="Thalassiosira miniscula, Strain CCMP1093" /LENGTH=388 /DNA_ID=CAMNT_0025978773 /DNA_START=43 /DNA_END=1210 /DNA_ORIENTATION=+